IRGFRIELGEIEASLLALPDVDEATVVACNEPAGRRLVAYFVGEAKVETLRRSLRERLPDYMVPAAFVALAALPLTPNGKVDRRALPSPDGPVPGEEHVAPRTPVEEVLAGIWAEVLGLERVGAVDHFFDLGGHSLLATQVMSRLRAVFRVEVPLRDLFAAPRLADFAARIEEARRAGIAESAPQLVPVPRRGGLPLSFAQQRLWFIDQLEPGSALYNIPVALRLAGPLDVAVLARALGAVVARHEALRTVFAVRDGEPVQVILPAAPVPLPVVDLAGLPGTAGRLLRDEANRPFDLRTGPLLRAGLLRLAGEEHVLLLTLHHIASDGWSMGLLVHEVTALYAASAAGRPSPLPAPPVQYGDFAVWQRSWLHGAVLAEEIAFWRRQLAGLPPLLELPVDRPRHAVQSFRGAARPVRFPADLTRRLETLGRREGATLFMVLLAGFQALLARTGGQEDLAVGAPVAGRNRVEIESLIGFFVNTLVLRGDLTGDPTFRELLHRVRETALTAYRHQDVPFEKLVQELAPERSLAHTPLFQVLLTLQNTPSQPPGLPGLTAELLSPGTESAKFDLTLALQESAGGLAGSLEYRCSLFDATTLERLAGHLLRLSSAAAADPDLRFSQLPLLSPQERHQLLVEGRGRDGSRGGSVPQGAGLHHLFAAQAHRHPEAPALAFRGQAMTYRDLERDANRLAHRLIAHGAGPEVRVGLCLERSPEMVVGLLAVLKAGGAYVPLDPELPAERLLFQLQDAGVTALVTRASGRAKVPLWEGPVLCLDDASGALDGWPDTPPTGAAGGDHLAYVLYTSGSTGRPKGVAVTHSNVMRLLEVTREPFGFGPGDTWTLFHSYAFDFSVWELWGALAHGGRVVVVPQDVARSPADFFRLLLSERVTVLNQTPSAFRQLAPVWNAAAEADGEPPVRWIFFGGEALELPSLGSWLARRGALPRLINMYGITETTVHVTLRPVRIEDTTGPARSLIGGPLADLELYVADRNLSPQPLGVPGELCVGGAGLARGYWRRPELTAARFVPDPWSGRPGARLYRSGDLGRRLPDGDVEYLGRIDHQVKIRGLRIELGEIEATLLALPGVRAAVVVARADGAIRGDLRLVAYVVGGAAVATLRQALREQLADYMVPASFVPMDALPLTPNGKIDRAALPAPDGVRPELAVSFVAPRTREELAVAAVWREVL
ncbi:MAG TPA: non-ribosomal peptide synthetase, partial [Acidobacteria bacterium]|nr:non-ribosomal peptide synthetase [Acidobacteriota bacterium]